MRWRRRLPGADWHWTALTWAAVFYMAAMAVFAFAVGAHQAGVREIVAAFLVRWQIRRLQHIRRLMYK